MKVSMTGDVYFVCGDQGDFGRYESVICHENQETLRVTTSLVSLGNSTFHKPSCPALSKGSIFTSVSSRSSMWILIVFTALSAPLRMSRIFCTASPSVVRGGKGRGARSKKIPGRCTTSHFSLWQDCSFPKSGSGLGSCAYEPPSSSCGFSSSPILAVNSGTIFVVTASKVSATPGMF